MFIKNFKNIFTIVFLVSSFTGNVNSMFRYTQERKVKTKKLYHEYPYDTSKMTFAEFSKTEEGRYFLKNNNHDIVWDVMFKKTEISDSLENLVYRTTCPAEIRDLIENIKLEDSGKIEKRTENTLVVHGTSGNGKSEIIRVIAKKTGRKFIFIQSAFIQTGYRDSEIINLREVLSALEKENVPAIIAFENADLLKPGSRNVICNFLNNENILFIFETSNYEEIDKRFIKKNKHNFDYKNLRKFLRNKDFVAIDTTEWLENVENDLREKGLEPLPKDTNTKTKNNAVIENRPVAENNLRNVNNVASPAKNNNGNNNTNANENAYNYNKLKIAGAVVGVFAAIIIIYRIYTNKRQQDRSNNRLTNFFKSIRFSS